MTFREERKRQNAERKAAVIEAEEREAIREFYRRNVKVVVACQANTERIINYFAGDPITLEALEEAFNSHPAFRASLALQSEARSRERLEKEIEGLLTGASSPGAVEEQLKSIRFRTTEDLQDWRDRLVATKSARSKSTAELRAEIRGAKPSPQQKELPSEISSSQIKFMLDAKAIRHLISVYGADAVTRRVNAKD